ncbi:hypothetical protein UAY_03403 [Enterococcus moraviensis ATCC BAA-383]|uniref:DUF1310 family protein n=1 Tax=Enterococcus moraviensis ATCC BAA-383 TaxID=1158609 RepID=R2QJ41_9ENTE|nr:hypothetical protein [Enterococcus moraviensis]EOH95213.1 hypothetical protein UAY_03403 [Enterococcus moraviensis ATCC BAA-383]EOT65143.1 hypothetical protein I586_02877 [Enterococcus moraviensis ATCC BAA-383]OJG66527.1 hypothetical protein RV09_GL000880 [Enterococcus moraviensis]
MNKRIVMLAAIAIMFIGLGGKIYVDYRADEKAKEEQKNLLAIERDSIVALKNTFSDVAFVKIEHSDEPNNMTDSYQIIFLMKNNLGTEVEFDAIYVKGETELKNYGVADEEVQKEGKTVSEVEVIYSDGTGGKQ